MFQTQSYPVPPPQYLPADYTPPSTGARYQYYSPRQYVFSSSPTPKSSHTRRATQDYGRDYYSTPSKKSPSYYPSSAEKTTYYTSTPAAQRKTEYVSDPVLETKGLNRDRSHKIKVESFGASKKERSAKYPSRSNRHPQDDEEVVYEYLPRYEQYPAHPPPYNRGSFQRHERFADQSRYAQVPIYGPLDSSSTKTRPRRASNTGKPTYSSASRPRPSTASSKTPRSATEEDARAARIPAGYSYKNWDPTEDPILLLGSVFDANSLGKWIYDWTVYFYGPAAPMSELAGELWLSLIQLADKCKNAEEALKQRRVRQPKNQDMVEEFVESGDRLWSRFNKLLKICENYMWKAAKRECGDAKHVTMGKTSGSEFVDSIFGRDRELERTEKLMTGIRLWCLRYTANVDPILADPLA